MNKTRQDAEQYIFHGVLRLKQSIDTYVSMDVLIGRKCFDEAGAIGEAHQQISEVFLRDIASGIFKCLYDQTSRINLRSLKNICCKKSSEHCDELNQLIEKMYKVAPPEEYLKEYRNKRLSHLDHIENPHDDEQPHFVENNFYKWFFSEIKEKGKLEFFDYLEGICFKLLRCFDMDTTVFLGSLKKIKEDAVVFWAYATKTVKNNDDVRNILDAHGDVKGR